MFSVTRLCTGTEWEIKDGACDADGGRGSGGRQESGCERRREQLRLRVHSLVSRSSSSPRLLVPRLSSSPFLPRHPFILIRIFFHRFPCLRSLSASDSAPLTGCRDDQLHAIHCDCVQLSVLGKDASPHSPSHPSLASVPRQLLGLAILATTIFLYVDSQNYVDFENTSELYLTPFLILMALGAVMTLVGFLGCCGAIRESTCVLGTVSPLLPDSPLMTCSLVPSSVVLPVLHHDVRRVWSCSLVVRRTRAHRSPPTAERDTQRRPPQVRQRTFRCNGSHRQQDPRGL